MNKTAELRVELGRFVTLLNEYAFDAEDNPRSQSTTHAAAKRSSLDLSRKLAEWRRTPVNYNGIK